MSFEVRCWADPDTDQRARQSAAGMGSESTASCWRGAQTSIGLCTKHYEEIIGELRMRDAFLYLTEDRGINEAVAIYADWRNGDGYYIIPYFDAFGRKRIERIHRPNGKPKYQSPSGSSGHLYCVENVRYPEVVICEGEIDTLSALSAGLKAIGVAGANSFYRPWRHLLDHADSLIIAYDGDDAGREAAAKLKSALPQARIADVPSGKDLNDILREEGADALKELIL